MQMYNSGKYTVDKICELVGGISRKNFYNIKNEAEANAKNHIPHNFVYLEKHLSGRNMHRYYRLYITSTLFGEYVLIREWGRCGYRKTGYSGALMQQWFSSIEEAQQAKENLVRLKKRKGYQVV